jgi:DNA-binding response OmpR family regulator
VLHIDDDNDVRDLVERAFAPRADIRLVSASRALLGLELARVHQPSVVLLDKKLPDLRGDEVLQRLRADPLTSSIPVIIVTKPFDVRSIVDRVDQLIVRSPAPPPHGGTERRRRGPNQCGRLHALLSPEGFTAGLLVQDILRQATTRAIQLPLDVFEFLSLL